MDSATALVTSTVKLSGISFLSELDEIFNTMFLCVVCHG